MKVNFWKVQWELAIGNLLDVLICYGHMKDLIVHNNQKFKDYDEDKVMYPSQPTAEKTNRSDELANSLNSTSITHMDNDS